MRASSAFWVGAGAALVVAAFSGWRDYLRRKRVDPDAVSAVDWRGVQMFALFACAILISIAFNA
jgi:hypothetical protein